MRRLNTPAPRSGYRLQDSLAYLVNRASRTIRRYFNQELFREGHTVTGEQFAVLVHIWDKKGICQQELADILHKDKTTLTRQLQQLQDLKLLERRAGIEDGRQRNLQLSPKGYRLMEALTKVAERVLSEAESGISPKSMTICREVLRKVHEDLSLRMARR